MRPDRFQRILADTAQSIPGVTGVKTLAEVGHTTHPYGVAIQAGGRESRWQIAAMSTPGDSYASAEPDPVLGEPVSKPEIQAAGDPASTARALIAAALHADPGEICSYDLYAELETTPAIPYGATIEFYDGSRIFLNFIR